MPRKSRCAHCRRRFVPHPRVKTQRFCANQACQRARKAQWQREKMATDPDYQANQRDAQQAWQHRHPGYWRQYRLRRAAYWERNLLLQTHRDHKRRATPLAKMDASASVTFVKPGVYHLIPAVGEHLAKMDGLSQKCHVIPIT
jgi:hypothetical protein